MFTNSAKHGFYAASGEAVGSAVDFAGTGLYKNTTSGFINAQDGPITFSFWVLANELTKDNTVLAINGTDLQIIIKSNGAIRVASQDAVDVTTVQTNLVGTSTWQHVMGSYTYNDSTAGHIYVDGVRYDWDEPTVNSGAFTFSTGDSSTVGDTIEVGGTGSDYSDISLYHLWVDNQAYDLSDADYKINFFNQDVYEENSSVSGWVNLSSTGQPNELWYTRKTVNQPLLYLVGGKNTFKNNGGRDNQDSSGDYWTVDTLEEIGTVEANTTPPDTTRATQFTDGVIINAVNYQDQPRLYVNAANITADAAISEDSAKGQSITQSVWWWTPTNYINVYGQISAFSFNPSYDYNGEEISFGIQNDFASAPTTPKMKPFIQWDDGRLQFEANQESPYWNTNGNWNHLYISWNREINEYYCYMNGIQVTTTSSPTHNPTPSSAHLPFNDWQLDSLTYDSSNADAEWQMGRWKDRQGNLSGLNAGAFSFMYYWMDNSYLGGFDGMKKFYSPQSTNKAVNIGSNGEIPLGRQPLVFHSGKYFTDDSTQGWRKSKGLWSYEFEVTTATQAFDGVTYPQPLSTSNFYASNQGPDFL